MVPTGTAGPIRESGVKEAEVEGEAQVDAPVEVQGEAQIEVQVEIVRQTSRS